jgi:hypothetical protein
MLTVANITVIGEDTVTTLTQPAEVRIVTIGTTGQSGYSGFSGPSGYSGFSGLSGYSGYSGVSGYSGFSGTSGYSGFSGQSGYSGFSSVSGYSGFSGYSAVAGGPGASGFSGFSGYSGYSGISGYSGFSSAVAGTSGYSGFSGFPTTIPQNSQSTNYTFVLGDAGESILHPLADTNNRTFTVPANSSVAYPVGTVITIINEVNTLTIAITTDTMTLYPGGSTGSRTLAANNIATLYKITSTTWAITGTSGLT